MHYYNRLHVRPSHAFILAVGLLSVHTVYSGAAVVDVYLLGGQSNMSGTGRSTFLTPDQASQPSILLYHSSTSVSTAGPNVLTTLRPAGASTGLFGAEISFGQRLTELRPDSKIAVIKHAFSGSNLDIEWHPGASASDTGNWGPQFHTFVNTVNAGLSAISSSGDLPIIRGMLWHQGEADSMSETMANSYEANITQLVARVREQWNVPGMPFVLANVLPDPIGIGPGDIESRFPYRDTVRQAQANIAQNSGHPAAIDGVLLVSTDDFQLHGDTQDGFRDNDFSHLDYSGLLDLGRGYADSIDMLTTDDVVGDLTGDRLVSIDDWIEFRSVLGTTITAATREDALALGDFNFDLRIDRMDFLHFKQVYLEANESATTLAVAVPEPSIACLLYAGVAAIGLLYAQRRMRSQADADQ